MEQTDPIQPATAYPATPATPAAPAIPAETAARAGVRVPAGVRTLWRYRALLAGVTALVLAVLGEALMRPGGGGPTNAALGTGLMQVAVLLVGLVAWVRDGLRLPGRKVTEVAPEAGAARRRVVVGAATPPAAEPLLIPHSSPLIPRLVALRARLGWPGTLLGLAIVAGLAIGCALLLRQDWGHPLAPWIWGGMLAALVLTFAGVGPWPKGASLVPHDPAEPADEPPVSRAEWLAVGLILAVALVVRLWNLEMIPTGPYTDEGDRAIDARHLNRGEPVNQTTFQFFGTGWWGVPSAYFWLVAQSLKLFGDTLAGARMVHALAGIASVWFTYRLGRVAWSPRVGLVAGGLLAVSDFAIQFSRTAGESTITLFTWLLCFYYLYKALKWRRPLDFVWSGIAGGLTLYGYVSGKLLPVFMVVVALYVLLRWGWTGARRYLPGLVLLAAAAALTWAPNALFVLAHPDTLTMRYNGVTITSPSGAVQMFAQYNTHNWLVVLAKQFEATYRAFDVGMERGPFYPTGQPILPVLWAALWVLGTAYLVWRAGDVRFAVLGIWLLSGLAGAALTNDTPTLQRVTGMVPVLALIPALYLDRVATGAPPLRWRAPWRSRAGLLRGVLAGLTAVLVIGLGAQTLSFYFFQYVPQELYYWYSRAGRYVQPLDYRQDTVYQMDAPEIFWWNGPGLWLADRVTGRDLSNLSDDLPLTDDQGKNAHFLVFDSYMPYFPTLEAYYPAGTKQVVSRPDGSPFLTAFRVGSDAFAARRQATAHYGPAAGPLFERMEPRLGTTGADGRANRAPDGLTYPTGAEWRAGLIVPVYGTYQLHLVAPAGATLEIDGRTMLTTTAGSPTGTDTPVVLAKGVHQVRLAGTLTDPNSAVELRWGTGSGALVPISPTYLWAGPPGVLLGAAYAGAPPDFFTAVPLALPPEAIPLVSRRDGVLAWRNLNTAMHNGGAVAVAWQGGLHIIEAGAYQFDAATDGRVSVLVDGQVVAAKNNPDLSQVPQLPIKLDLTAGDHPFEIRFQAAHDNQGFDFYWTPPGKDRALLPPEALTVPPGGVWTPAERPGVPSPEATVIQAAASALAGRLVREIPGNLPWQEARGLAVFPDGRVVVADSGHHRLILYAPDGQIERTWGVEGGDADGHFNQLTDLVVNPEGVLAALDGENGNIQLFHADGQLVTRLPAARVGLRHASGIAWGPDGSLWVADTGNSRVVHLARDGTPLAAWREGNGTLAPLEQPTDVAVTLDGTVYAVDLRGRVVRFNAAGRIEHEWTVPVGASRGGNHLAVWNNLLAVTNPNENSLHFIDLMAGVVRNFAPSTPPPFALDLPVGVATGPDGLLYVLDSGGGRVAVVGLGP
jgi:4-amino-4-deoxy-L-arabinose transferase-like glycosyltransferase